MQPPLKATNEAERMEALRRYGLLDTEPEQVLDELTTLASHICEAPICLLSVMDEDRQWFKSKVGLRDSELPRNISFCGHTILQPDLFMVPDAAQDERFADNPLVTGDHHIRFYAGVPLMTLEGHALGTLCVIDQVPRRLNPLQQEALEVLSRQAMTQLELRRQARELAENERLLKAIFDSEPECVKVLGPDGSVRMMNRAGLEMIEADSFGQVAGHCVYPLVTLEHRVKFEALTQRVFCGESGTMEFQILGLKGAMRWLETHAVPLRDEQGKIISLLGITRDITEHKQAEAAMRESEEKFRKLFQQIPDAILLTTLDGRILNANPGFTQLTGHAFEDIRGRTTLDLNFWGSRADREHFISTLRKQGRAQEFESQFRTRSGETRICTISGELMELGHEPVIVGIVRDITARKQAEAEVYKTFSTLQLFIDSVPHFIAFVDAKERYQLVNRNYEEWFGRPSNQIIGRTLTEMHRPTTYEKMAPHIREVMAGRATRFENEMMGRDGRKYYFDVRYVPRHSPDGLVMGYFVLALDVTERKVAEQTVRESEQKLRKVIDGLGPNTFLGLMTPDGILIEANRPGLVAAGLRLEDVQGKPFDQTHWWSHSETVREELRGAMVRAAAGEPSRYDVQVRVAGDKLVWIDFSLYPVRDADGRVSYLVPSGNVIDERKQAEEHIRWKSAFFEAQVDSALDGILVVNSEGRKILQNQRMNDLLKIPRDIVENKDDAVQLRFVTSQMKNPEQFANRVAYLYTHPEEVGRDEIELRDGTILDRYSSPVRDKAGKHYGRIWAFRDITDRRKLEEQFRQSQKMEAIGQLAGGVAHDFNNILAAIMMQADLAIYEGNSPEQMRELLLDIKKAAERAANLTRQLLAFSRRQVMQPHQLDLNEVVTNLAKMLRRILGEDVQLQLQLHPRALQLRADAGMLDQALLNLVVNARDAMPGGGRLIIETGEKTFTVAEAALIPDAKPGRHYYLRVTDVGTGISPENLTHIFEPFFTTKELGKGTGLGLATVFGIVKQHGGSVAVESEVGRGTTFQIFLPVMDATIATPDKPAEKPEPRGGLETLLLVEDEPSVRRLTRTVLERAGYQVFEAPDGVAALRIWEQHHESIRLLLTDMVMPEGISGHELAARLQMQQPKLRVIFISGYSSDIAGRELSLQEGQNFIQKPAAPQQLLETVRSCLDN